MEVDFRWNRATGLVSEQPSQFRGLPWLDPILVDASGQRIEKSLCVWEQLASFQKLDFPLRTGSSIGSPLMGPSITPKGFECLKSWLRL